MESTAFQSYWCDGAESEMVWKLELALSLHSSFELLHRPEEKTPYTHSCYEHYDNTRNEWYQHVLFEQYIRFWGDHDVFLSVFVDFCEDRF